MHQMIYKLRKEIKLQNAILIQHVCPECREPKWDAALRLFAPVTRVTEIIRD